MIRVLIVEVGHAPREAQTDKPFDLAKLLTNKATIQMIELDDGVVVYSDEDGLGKDLPLNREIPARMPHLDTENYGFIIKPDDLEVPAPGEMGVHRIHGHFMLLRHGDGEDDYADLTDADVAKYTALFGGA